MPKRRLEPRPCPCDLEIAALQAKVRKLESASKKGKQAASIVNQMLHAGMISQDGEDSVLVQSNGKQQRIRAEDVESMEFGDADDGQ